ncbi:MAG TPA: hypothetical protein VHI52_10690, partial [Verrucomicrobiae bacterium]|nr:hypothetical protein [Verrucomicrobiae bacterium]
MNLDWYELEFPPELPPEPLLQFMRSLAARARRGLLMLPDPLIIEVEGAGGRLTWRLGITEREAEQVLGTLYSSLPNVRSTPVTPDRITPQQAWELRTTARRRPLRTDVPTEVATALLVALQAAGPDERLVVQWVIGGWVLRNVIPSGRVQPGGSSWLPGQGELVLTTEQAAAARTKQQEPLFEVVTRVGVTAKNETRRRQLRQRVVGSLQLLRLPGNGFERRLWPSWFVKSRLVRCKRPRLHWPCVLSASELMAAVGIPVGNPVLAGVTYSGQRQLPARSAVVLPLGSTTTDRVTGRVTFPGQDGLLTQTVGDSLSHTWCMAPTGAGKSWWLAGLALGEVAAGRGLIVVDGKGDLVRD